MEYWKFIKVKLQSNYQPQELVCWGRWYFVPSRSPGVGWQDPSLLHHPIIRVCSVSCLASPGPVTKYQHGCPVCQWRADTVTGPSPTPLHCPSTLSCHLSRHNIGLTHKIELNRNIKQCCCEIYINNYSKNTTFLFNEPYIHFIWTTIIMFCRRSLSRK